MRLTLLFHITAGVLGLLSGAIALYTHKGGRQHRASGTLFVWTMLPMAAAGFVLSTVGGVAPEMNVPVAALTTYLVVTAVTTVRPASAARRRLDSAMMGLGLATGLGSLALGVAALARPGIPDGFAYPLFMFGVVGLLAVNGDFRVQRSGELRGTRRLARHLWRMCFALFIAALSFFIGQADVFPEPIRIRPLLALPVLAVLVTMVYWLWRLRGRPRPALTLSAIPLSSQDI